MFATLALYRIERPGEGVLTTAAHRFGYLGDQRNQGIELTLNGEIAPGLRLITGLALTDAELDSGQEVPGVPEFTANANVEWDLPFVPGLTLTGRVTHTGEQFADAANTLKLDSWTVLDLGARYVFAAGDAPVTLRLTVDNVTDEPIGPRLRRFQPCAAARDAAHGKGFGIHRVLEIRMDRQRKHAVGPLQTSTI